MKECYICGKDVCADCAMHLDLDCNLESPNYTGDYPTFICKKCWEKGIQIRKQIMISRYEAEKMQDKLWSEWERLSKEDNVNG